MTTRVTVDDLNARLQCLNLETPKIPVIPELELKRKNAWIQAKSTIGDINEDNAIAACRLRLNTDVTVIKQWIEEHPEENEQNNRVREYTVYFFALAHDVIEALDKMK
jgi:hypothetical protein